MLALLEPRLIYFLRLLEDCSLLSLGLSGDGSLECGSSLHELQNETVRFENFTPGFRNLEALWLVGLDAVILFQQSADCVDSPREEINFMTVIKTYEAGSG